MKIFRDSKNKSNFLLATYIVILAYIFLNLDKIGKLLLNVVSVIKPFLIGGAIAFVLNILMKIYEEKVFKKLFDKCKKIDLSRLTRIVSLIATIITIMAIIISIMFFVVPQLIESGKTLGNNIPTYLESLEEMVGKYYKNTNLIKNIYTQLIAAGKEIIKVAGTLTSSIVGQVVDITVGITSTITTAVIALIVSIYILLSKERLGNQAKKIIYAVFNEKVADKTIKLSQLCYEKFSKFVGGQCLEALILGILCFISMSIFRMPYPLLISTLICITALVPIVGAFIGVIPSAFIILMVDPIQAIWFIILIIVIQQIEGHVIYPFVVGSSIGLSALWVLFAITVGGKLFGIIGMLIGVPLFGVIYTLIGYFTNKRLNKKRIKVENGIVSKIANNNSTKNDNKK